MKVATKERIEEIAKIAAKKKEEILKSPSEYPKGKKTYYVDSIDGNDENDGLSEETAWRTIDKLNTNEVEKDSVVLFRRGGLWRGTVFVKEGVYYSAYGEGNKPKFYGSLDASNPDDWAETKYKNVWIYRPMIAYVKDVGAVVFNDGECWGIKVCKNYVENVRCDMGPAGTNEDVFNGRKMIHRERGPLNGYGDLKSDLEFYHNYADEHLYLYCADGNPGKVFKSIELSLRRNVFQGGRNVTLDNLCIKYTGIHGIAHSGQNICVKNCEIGWIGGSNQFPEHQIMGLKMPFRDDVTRLGNGCEVYGGCNNYEVKNCYFYQIYDAAVTAQYMNGHVDRDIIMNNISWHDNLIDTSNYCFELWLAVQDKSENNTVAMRNVDISNNICTNCGYGMSSQRPDPSATFFYGDPQKTVCEFDNVVFRNNIFANGYGKISVARMFGGKNGMKFDGNDIYHSGKYLATHAEDMENYEGTLKKIEATDENVKMLIENGYWKDCKYSVIDKDPSVSEPYIKF